MTNTELNDINQFYILCLYIYIKLGTKQEESLP
jgi:hypothetical protein